MKVSATMRRAVRSTFLFAPLVSALVTPPRTMVAPATPFKSARRAAPRMALLDSLLGAIAPPARSPPALYNGWFNGEIERGMAASIRAARSDGFKYLEVAVFPVPNPDEVKFGTPYNQV